MSDPRVEHRERVVRTVDYNTGYANCPDALDADHIRVHLCANAQYAVEVEGGYVVANDQEVDDR